MPNSIHSADILKNIPSNKEASCNRKTASPNSVDSSVQKTKIIKKTYCQSLNRESVSQEGDSSHNIDFLFAKLIYRAEEARKNPISVQLENSLINLDASFSEEALQKTLHSCFVKTLLRKTKKEIRCALEADPCSGQYWKELHEGSNISLPLEKLQKLYFCLDSFVHPLPKTPEEMLVIIKEKLNYNKRLD